MTTVREMAIAVGILERGGKVLLIRRRSKNPMWDKKWEFPAGKIEPGEEARDAVVREFMEETGVEVVSPVFLGIHTYDWNMQDSSVLCI